MDGQRKGQSVLLAFTVQWGRQEISKKCQIEIKTLKLGWGGGCILCGPVSLEHCRNGNLPLLTTAHQVFSEERAPEPNRKHMEVRSKVGEQLLEVRIIGTKISKGSSHEHSMGVKPKYVVVTWIQITSFDEL